MADLGNTIVVIEHNLDVIKCADWLIDMGPEGGDGGGTVLAAGTPERIAETLGSHTGEYLKPRLENPTAPLIELPMVVGRRSRNPSAFAPTTSFSRVMSRGMIRLKVNQCPTRFLASTRS